MSLIKCPDCEEMVSDRAEKCLKCGRPIVNMARSYGTYQPSSSSPPIQTIEKTSKKLKGWMMAWLFIFALSTLLLMIGGAMESDFLMGTGLLMFLGSATGLVVIKFKVWWEHE